MNSTRILCWTIVAMLFVTLALPLSLTAQNSPSPTSRPTMIAGTAHREEDAIYRGRSLRSTGVGPINGAPSRQRPSQGADSKIAPDGGETKYDVVQIGVLPGKTNSYVPEVASLNNLGHAIGYSYLWTGDFNVLFLTAQGFVWQNGKLKALPLLKGWPGAIAFGINDRDQVVGRTTNFDSIGNLRGTAVLWDHGQPIDLGTLTTNSDSFAFGVNNWGVSVGSNHTLGEDHGIPVVWYGGTIHQLPLLTGETGGGASLINDLGVIVGWQSLGGGNINLVPCLWYWNGTGYTTVNLGNLGGDYGEAFGINNLGQAVGWSLCASDLHGPGVLWNLRGPHALPSLTGDTDGTAVAISDLGQIVGFSALVDDNGNLISQRVVTWQNGTPTDLQTLVPPGSPTFTDIGNANRLGQISIDSGDFGDGTIAAYVLIPKDE